MLELLSIKKGMNRSVSHGNDIDAHRWGESWLGRRHDQHCRRSREASPMGVLFDTVGSMPESIANAVHVSNLLSPILCSSFSILCSCPLSPIPYPLSPVPCLVLLIPHPSIFYPTHTAASGTYNGVSQAFARNEARQDFFLYTDAWYKEFTISASKELRERYSCSPLLSRGTEDKDVNRCAVLRRIVP